mmetsp:Transcript_52809/g.112731  ORF Transcript_52809/g.112731 Transcript_52809/m.112731 type:complete len:175 (+) Transcript_52809:117-641(+)
MGMVEDSEPGVPAMMALGLVTVTGILLALLSTWHLPVVQARVVGLSLVCLCTSSVFFVWAVKNCAKHLDLGVLTFGFTLIFSFVGILSGWGAADLELAKWYRWGGPLGCGLVCMNYVAGLAIFKKHLLLRAYMMIGVVWWLIAGLFSLEFAATLVRSLAAKGNGDGGQPPDLSM